MSVSLCVCGAGELVGMDDTTELGQEKGENLNGVDGSQDPAAVRLINIMTELGAGKLFKE